MKRKKIFLIGILSIALLFSCNNDDNNSTNGSLTIEFDNVVSMSEDLTLNVDAFTNSSDETINISELKYIISNIVLIDENGGEFVYPKADSYRVVNELDNASRTITLNNIPYRNYTQVRFGLGVDPTQYPLDQLQNFIPQAEETDMLWAWAAGYKFIKFEGNYTPNGGTEAPFIYHVGSHGTNQDNYKVVTLNLPGTARVDAETTPFVHIMAMIPQVFDGTTTIDLSSADNVQVDPVNAPIISTNFSNIFMAHHVEN
ncbi:MAG: hypothetical protein HRT68_03230 [Flavobacteriaceae bacterium]|nr:hypothetical protein [Flavobacteriaceae bacterium]